MDDGPPARLAGLDWPSRLHAVCVLDPDGQVRARFEVPHTGKSLRGLIGRLHRLGVAKLAIERPDGPVVEALLSAGIQVVVIPSRQVKHLWTRYGSAGNKDDRFDADVLADVLGTDGHRLACLQPDSPHTAGLRAVSRARKQLVQTRVALANQLRANLEIAFAGDSRRANPWAAYLYNQARARGHRHPHAVRILARAWLRVIWRCWQDHTAYDPTRHGAYQRLIAQEG